MLLAIVALLAAPTQSSAQTVSNVAAKSMEASAKIMQKIELFTTYFKGANIADISKKNMMIAAVASTKTKLVNAASTIANKKDLLKSQKELMKGLTTQIKENLTKPELKEFGTWRKANMGKR